MGCFRVNKAILFDETELSFHPDNELDELAEIVTDTLQPYTEELQDRMLTPLALLSERHDATVMLDTDYVAGPNWLHENTGWKTGLANIARDIFGLAGDEIAAFQAGPVAFRSRILDAIAAHLQAKRYLRASRLCEMLEGHEVSGLPGFLVGGDPTDRGGDDTIDRRLTAKGTGTRLILEVSVTWV